MFDGLVLVNFGGPRNLKEVTSFLKSLLCDQDVVRTGFPQVLHNILFSYIAKKRAKTVALDYDQVGGKSPIFEDTERLQKLLTESLGKPVFAFHRYLAKTHGDFIKALGEFEGDNLLVFPLFPQFSYATTGSCARFFEENLCGRVLEKMLWISSYADHPAFINAYKKKIEEALTTHQIDEKEVCLVYSFHGIPRKFVCYNDPYEKHCNASFQALSRYFPEAQHVQAYQSKFGKGEWLKPYTQELVDQDLAWLERKKVLFVPLSFTSDHIETLYEVEELYITPLRDRGIFAARVQAIHTDFSWVEEVMASSTGLVSTAMLVRKEKKACCNQQHGCCVCALKKQLLKQTVEQNS